MDQQFKKEFGFKAALEKACTQFINKNAVTGKALRTNFSAESLATYCHILLRKSNKSMDDTDIDTALDEIMIVFRFIEDKDVFEGFYKRRLAERLVWRFSLSFPSKFQFRFESYQLIFLSFAFQRM